MAALLNGAPQLNGAPCLNGAALPNRAPHLNGAGLPNGAPNLNGAPYLNGAALQNGAAHLNGHLNGVNGSNGHMTSQDTEMDCDSPFSNGCEKSTDITLDFQVSSNIVPIGGRKRSREDTQEGDLKRQKINGVYAAGL